MRMTKTLVLALSLSLMAGALALCPPAVRAQPGEADRAGALRGLVQDQARFDRNRKKREEEEPARYRKALDAIKQNDRIVEDNSVWLDDLAANWDCRFAQATIRELEHRRGEVRARLDSVKSKCRGAATQSPAVRDVCADAKRKNTKLLERFDRMEKQYADQSAQCPPTTSTNSASTP